MVTEIKKSKNIYRTSKEWKEKWCQRRIERKNKDERW